MDKIFSDGVKSTSNPMKTKEIKKWLKIDFYYTRLGDK
jgi:hypothetical protein